MDTTIATEWGGFLTAAAGATGALAGLVFVSLSINLTRILAGPGLTGRAGETMILLGSTLAVTLIALIPGLSPHELALALLAITLPTWLALFGIQAYSICHHRYLHAPLATLRLTLSQVATIPGVLAPLAMMGFLPGGFSWLAFGVIASILVALMNAWVLLVEILR